MSKNDREDLTAPSASVLDGPLEERRGHALRDLAELDVQVAAGELDEATAARLRAGYEAELEAVEQLASHAAPAPALEGRSPQRAIAGSLVLIGALTVVILVAAQTFRSDGGPAPQAPSATSAIDEETLNQIEELLATHPDSPGMRVALADLYFERGDFASAIDHYLAAVEGELTPEEEGRTLGRIGWMAYSTGQLGPAVEYLHASLEADPGYDEGKLFLAMVLFEGFGDAGGAVELFEEILALPDLNDEMRRAVEAAADEARAALESP
jgi:cytochrome c-type biogenesis protein CcmH/NrfG